MAVVEELLAAAKQVAAEADVYHVSFEETPVAFEGNQLKSILTRQSEGIALRLVKDGRIGFASAMGAQSWQEILDHALETAQFGAEARFHLPGAAAFPVLSVYDAAVSEYPLDRMVESGQRAIDLVLAANSEIVCDATLVKRVTDLRLLNTAGFDATYRKTGYTARIEGTLVRGTDMLFVGDRLVSCSPIPTLDDLAAETVRQLELARDTVPAPQGQVPVVFTPRGFAQAFMPALSQGFSGRTVAQKASPLTEKLGQLAFDKRLTLIDDPTQPMAPGSRPFDDEGVPSQRLALVEQGMLQRFFYDLQSAGLAGATSTGSAQRGVGTLPAPGLSTLMVQPGQGSFEELLADIQEGLVVEEMLGATQGNVLGGDFGGNVLLGYKVERGRIVGRVKDTMVAGNVYTILGDLAGLGGEPRWVGGSVFAPPIVTLQATVSTKA